MSFTIISFSAPIKSINRPYDKDQTKPEDLYVLRFSLYLSSQKDKHGKKSHTYETVFCSLFASQSNQYTLGLLEEGKLVQVVGTIDSIRADTYKNYIQTVINIRSVSVSEIFAEKEKEEIVDDESSKDDSNNDANAFQSNKEDEYAPF